MSGTRAAQQSTNALICRIAGVSHSDTYALFGILIRGSVDLVALRHIVAADPQRSHIAEYALVL